MRLLYILLILAPFVSTAFAKEYHVSPTGKDSNSGSVSSPLVSISEAAKRAHAGDTITVHAGVYREWVKPARGGESDSKRIIYRAAPGEKAEIKGSEIIRGWKKVKEGIWEAVISDSFFGDYNPFRDSVHGDWFHPLGRVHHTGDVFLNGRSLYEVETTEKVYQPVIDPEISDSAGQKFTWHCENKDDYTIIRANFHHFNPNEELVEASARKTCFYPEKEGINYITVSGFYFSQAATQWAAPTAEQVGMIATHWNKGWIIENNVIYDSKCSGITLGKERGTGHNVWSNDAANINRDGNIHYIEVIFRVLRNNWNRTHIGSHIVRNNSIYNCEQAGICGSMGAIFSTIENNHIYNINRKGQFKGWEISGIKFHAPVDVIIRNNRIHDCERGIWLDWMTQGTRVSSNLLYRNRAQDLFIEVNHGPYIIDNNILLSPVALSNWSQGGAYIHNLFAGQIHTQPVLDRFTPYFLPHSVDMAGLTYIFGGDDHFYNNIFAWSNDKDLIACYDSTRYASYADGNVYLNGVRPPETDDGRVEAEGIKTDFELQESGDEVYLVSGLDRLPACQDRKVIVSGKLGKTKISKSAFENQDGSSIVFDKDYFGNAREGMKINAGPFATSAKNLDKSLKVW